jgi:hypothetical protein
VGKTLAELHLYFKMRTSFTTAGAAALLISASQAQIYPGQSTLNHTCQLQKPLLSCPSQDPSKVDSCCVETFGGLVLSTQFWNTYTGREDEGQFLPKDTWGLHGTYFHTLPFTSLRQAIRSLARLLQWQLHTIL